MAEKKSGPVKPPTLDMQARKPSPRTPSKPADAPKSTSETTDTAQRTTGSSAQQQQSEPPRRAASSRSESSRSVPASAPFPLIPALFSALVGAIIAVLTILGLATTGALTGLMPQPASDQTERLTFAEEQVSEALVGFNALNRQVSDMQTRLDSAIASAEENADLLTARQDELETTVSDLPTSGTAQPVDLSQIQSQIDQLVTRITALQSGASSEDADTLASDLAEMRTTLSSVTEQVADLERTTDELTDSLTTTNDSLLSESAVITALQADLAELQSEPGLPSTDSQLLRLPLALSGLETAREAGRPFATELESLLTLVPDLSASDALKIQAETGLPAPGRISVDFARKVPAIMAARPADPDAGLMDTLLARAQALLAIRPTGETGADPVTDTLARAEQALADRQFANAAAALAALPDPMQEAAGETLASITLMGEAETLLAEARASVLAASDAASQPADDGAAE